MIGKVKVQKCSRCDCGQKRLIVNKTHFLCYEKNQQRLEDNRSTNKVNKAKNLISKTSLSSKNKLGLSSKKAKQNKTYNQVCHEILQERGQKCQGCNTNKRLSFSHLIPRSRRPDLITNKDNIHIHCMDGDGIEGCHQKCESGKFDELLDGQQIIETIKKIDKQYYQLKVMKNGYSS